MAGFKNKKSGKTYLQSTEAPFEFSKDHCEYDSTAKKEIFNFPEVKQRIENNEQIKVSKADKNRYVGIAINCGMVEDEESSVSRWFKSFFYGIDYSSSSIINVFTLVTEESMNTVGDDIGNQYEVLLYGDISGSRLNPNEKVEVIGKLNGNNQIEAKTITKVNSRVKIRIKKAISATCVRFITMFIILLPFILACILALVNS